jgi:hypothetical protein
VPLLAGAIRHAERVALAMDARAFGAHPDRTERHLVPCARATPCSSPLLDRERRHPRRLLPWTL